MKNNLFFILIILVLIMPLCSCSNRDGGTVALKDSSKVIAIVGNVNITQQQLDIKRKDSTYSGQEKIFYDKEVLDDIITDKLLLIKAKEFNIKMSDKEVKEAYKGMLESMSSKQYVKGDEEKIDKNAIEQLRNIFIIQKVKEKLGSNIDKTLKQLRQNVKIIYYN